MFAWGGGGRASTWHDLSKRCAPAHTMSGCIYDILHASSLRDSRSPPGWACSRYTFARVHKEKWRGRAMLVWSGSSRQGVTATHVHSRSVVQKQCWPEASRRMVRRFSNRSMLLLKRILLFFWQVFETALCQQYRNTTRRVLKQRANERSCRRPSGGNNREAHTKAHTDAVPS